MSREVAGEKRPKLVTGIVWLLFVQRSRVCVTQVHVRGAPLTLTVCAEPLEARVGTVTSRPGDTSRARV